MSSNHEKKSSKIKPNQPMLGAGIAIGIGVGVAVGSVIGNVGAGLAIGISIGIAFGVGLQKKDITKQNKNKPK